jgi:hypothetical protein
MHTCRRVPRPHSTVYRACKAMIKRQVDVHCLQFHGKSPDEHEQNSAMFNQDQVYFCTHMPWYEKLDHLSPANWYSKDMATFCLRLNRVSNRLISCGCSFNIRYIEAHGFPIRYFYFCPYKKANIRISWKSNVFMVEESWCGNLN